MPSPGRGGGGGAGARADEAWAVGDAVVAGVGGGVAAVVESGTVVAGAVAAVVFTEVSCRADQMAAESTTTTAQSKMIRRASTASVCPFVRR